MKKTLLFTALLVVTQVGFAQGKISFKNDTLHLVYLNPDPAYLAPADASLAGQPVPVGGILPSGAALVVDLFAGTSASSLQSVATVASWPSAGEWLPDNLTLNGLAAGVPLDFQVQVHDALDLYFGESPVFTCVAGPGIGYDSIVNSGSPSFSTWGVGPYPLDGYSPGDKGAIVVSLVPEPATAALAGLGAAMALLRCRRETKRYISVN
jgi:hypothetical protein